MKVDMRTINLELRTAFAETSELFVSEHSDGIAQTWYQISCSYQGYTYIFSDKNGPIGFPSPFSAIQFFLSRLNDDFTGPVHLSKGAHARRKHAGERKRTPVL